MIKNLAFPIRAITGMFFAFWIIVSGIIIMPQIVNIVSSFSFFIYALSIMFSAVFIILYSMGFFDELNNKKEKK